MAMKALSFLLAYMLLVTARVSLFAEAVETEHIVATPPSKAPVHPPVKAHPAYPPHKPYAHPPAKAPSHHDHHAPEKSPEKEHHHHHHHAHAPAPMHPPVKKVGAPVPAPKYGCPTKCAEYCKKDKKESCVKECTACCDKSKCVPEHNKKCSWGHVKMGYKMVKCP